jgi:hypothetical protein
LFINLLCFKTGLSRHSGNSDLFSGRQQSGKFICGQRPAEIKSLTGIATLIAQKVCLEFRASECKRVRQSTIQQRDHHGASGAS